MKKCAIALGGMALLLSAAGCGGDPSTVMTQTEADSIYSTVQTIASTHQSGACAGGGTVTRSERTHINLASVGLIETYELSGCMIDGLLLEGSFEYQEIVDTGGQALVYQGTLTTGAGTCYLNLTFRTGFSGIEAPSGSYCGFAARPSMTP